MRKEVETERLRYHERMMKSLWWMPSWLFFVGCHTLLTGIWFRSTTVEAFRYEAVFGGRYRFGLLRKCRDVPTRFYADRFWVERRTALRRYGSDSTNDNVFSPKEEDEISNMSVEERQNLWKEIAQLEKKLYDKVMNKEGFDEATELREKINELKNQDPYIMLLKTLEEAEKEQRYVSAASIRLQMDKVGKPPSPEFAEEVDVKDTAREEAMKRGDKTSGKGTSDNKTNAKNTSLSIQHGIRVFIESQYAPEHSDPARNLYMFTYKVSIKNEGTRTVQLISRKWEIKTLNGKKDVVKGPGVVGVQPVLQKGETFEYQSSCPLRVNLRKDQLHEKVLGSMRGVYYMVGGDRGEEPFEVNIQPLNYILPNDMREKRKNT